MKENDAMRPISNERPEFLALEKCNESAIACYSDGENKLWKNELGQSSHRWRHMSKRYASWFSFHVLYKKVSRMQKKINYWLEVIFLWFKSMILCNLWLGMHASLVCKELWCDPNFI